MAKLTNAEVTDELVALYQAKQDLAALDEALNTQAATIMDKARADVQAIKDGQESERTAIMAAKQQAESRLNRGK